MGLIVVRRARLVAGLVLLASLTLHFLDHALGLVSLAAMEAGRVWFLALWRDPLGTAARYEAIIVHGVSRSGSSLSGGRSACRPGRRRRRSSASRSPWLLACT